MSRSSLALRLVACGCGLVAVLAPGSSAAGSSPRQVRVGPAPRPPSLARALGALADSTRMNVTIALRPRDPAALAAYASAVSTPGSGVYRDYLSVAQFASRFAPASAQIDAVESSLRAHGLQPGIPSANRLSIPVSASARQIARAFSLSLIRFALPGGRIAVASTAAPLLDASVARLVQGVVGLENLSAPRPLAVRGGAGQTRARAATATPNVATGGPQPCSAASSSASSAAPAQSIYTADQIASAYRFSGLYGAGDQGAGQTIALYELEPNDPADIAAYQSCYGTNASVSYVPVDGGVGSGPGSGEAALDIEDVIGLAPRAKVVVYQGPNSSSNGPGAGPYDTYNAIVSQNAARVISTSWGSCEPMEGSSDAQAESTLFQEAAVQGQSILSAAGDSGSEDCNTHTLPNPGLAVDDPASQPFVTGVGGTTMPALGPPPTETVWNNAAGNVLLGLTGIGPGASGGGISTLWPMPTYQSGAPPALHVTNSSSSPSPCGATAGYCRQVPDVSADADPNTGYLIYWNGGGSVTGAPSGWQGIGGSSASAPTWAALIVLANASRACGGSPIGFANPALYRVAGGAYGSNFNDVTSGNNDYTTTNGGKYPAGAGYDMASGLGTPVGATLAADLCGSVPRISDPGAQRSTVGSSVHLRLRVADYAGARLSYSAKGLPAGLSIARATGLIAGTPTRARGSSAALTVRDGSGQTASATFTWTVKFATLISSSAPVARCARQPRSTHRVCMFSARGAQTVHARSGHRPRISAHVLTTTGAPIAGALVSLADGKRTLTARASRSGIVAFTLAAGRDRSVRLSYPGDSTRYPSSATVAIRNG